MNRAHTKLSERLEASGEELVRLIGQLDAEDLKTSPDGGWTLHQQLTHLRDTEHVFLRRAERILHENHPAVENFDQEAYMREHYTGAEPLKQIASQFAKARRGLIRLLREGTDKDWNRTAAHSAYGTITLEWIALHAYAHTLDHMAQFLYRRDQALLKRLNG